VSGISTLDQPTLDILFALFTKRASYIGIKPTTAAVTSSVSTIPGDYLEQLSGFANFKLLGDSLEVSFKKRITLIFGGNGSGKSSICESLKVLATSQQPSRPLENVRAVGNARPTFRFKFKSDAGQQTWTPVVGYGQRKATIKYFDTAIAVQNVTSAVEPGRIIILTPFKLHIFEWVKALTTEFRSALQQTQQYNWAKLTQTLVTIHAEFEKFKRYPLATIDDTSVTVLPGQIKLGEEFTDQKLLSEKQTTATELEKATSEEGLKLLRAEHRELESFLTSLNTLLNSVTGLWALEPANKIKTLAEKQAAQKVLAKAIIPKDGSLDGLLGLLRATSQMCKMDEAAGLACPLCKRDLGTTEIELFKQYHSLLAGELEKDITNIKADITSAHETSTAIGQVDRKVWDKYDTIPKEILNTAKNDSGIIVASCDISKEPTAEAKAALKSLKTSAITWATQLASKKSVIDVAVKGKDELVKQLANLRAEIEPLEYKLAIAERLVKLKEVQQMMDESQYWKNNLPTFTQVLKKITEKAKDAYEELVVVDFEARLDMEYKALAEKDMVAFGVMLARKGSESVVTVLPQIGGRDIEGVLSEGEQRLHALALFFAELETCQQSVLVFDDPISSFDYNYIANYCTRLRDFTVKYPTKQLIVLTHNWEFFVQLQQTLKKVGLNNDLTVQILENCVQLAEYSEEIDNLKAEIDAILVLPVEPTKKQKEDLAGNMRRLMEAVVNTYSFNNQRHQFKQKSQSVSDFQKFTKIVALLPAEATQLRDLYEKLSIPEHGGDPRNCYVTTDKAMFQTRYIQIVDIETAIKARIP
jgi:recombinational DNA repair ATPase RecF